MNDLKVEDKIKRKKHHFSEEEKQAHCSDWRKSALTQHAFCHRKGISISALKRWLKNFTPETEAGFAAVSIKRELPLKNEERIPVEIHLSHHLQLTMSVTPGQLVFLTQELIHAAAIVR